MRKSLAILFIASLLCSCQKENAVESAYGWLCIENVSVNGHTLTGTKGTVDSDFAVTISDTNGQKVADYTAGNVPPKIALPVGSYKLLTYSSNIDAWKEDNSGSGSAAFRDETEFTIEPEIYSYVKVIASMVNYGVRFSVEEGLDQWFPQISLTVDGSEGRSLSLARGITGWLDDESINVSLIVTNTDGDSFKGATYKLSPEKGHIYSFKYTLSPTIGKDGNTSLSITIDDAFADGECEYIVIEE